MKEKKKTWAHKQKACHIKVFSKYYIAWGNKFSTFFHCCAKSFFSPNYWTNFETTSKRKRSGTSGQSDTGPLVFVVKSKKMNIKWKTCIWSNIEKSHCQLDGNYSVVCNEICRYCWLLLFKYSYKIVSGKQLNWEWNVLLLFKNSVLDWSIVKLALWKSITLFYNKPFYCDKVS